MGQKNMNVYKRRQAVLLICIAVILIALMAFLVYFFIIRDQKDISGGESSSVSQQIESDSSGDIPADAQSSSAESNSVDFKDSELTLKIGEKKTPEINGDTSLLTGWTSSNTAVAVVDENGEITGVSEGSCEITARLSLSDIGNTIKLKVTVTSDSEHDVVVENGITYIDGIIIANKSYSLPADYDPGENQEALDAFYQMQSDAAAEGLDIYISSSYRSYYDQERIYNNYVAQDGQEAADTYSSRPGYSDHQTGLAFDLNSIDDSFGLTPESDWVAANAHKYGFIIRFPKGKEAETGYQYEPWHIRYLGVEKATEVYESGLSLEEFLGIDSVYKD